MTQPTEELMIGPLTATEWATLILLDDHPRAEENPLPPCCADISEARDAILGAMRAGGDPDVCWVSICLAWPIVDSHLNLGGAAPNEPVLRKIYDTYVAGRDLGGFDEADAKARMMARDVDLVRQILATTPSHYDLDTAEGRMRAIARVGGAFVGYVRDQAERTTLIRELAAVVGMSYEDVAMMVDVLRLSEGLPWAPAEGARVP